MQALKTKSKEYMTNLIAQFQNDNKELVASLHKLRTDYYVTLNENRMLKYKVDKVARDQEMMATKMDMVTDERDIYKKQVHQYHQYMDEVSVIKEQFEQARVAQNQVQILQDLQQTKFNLTNTCNQLEIEKQQAVN